MNNNKKDQVFGGGLVLCNCLPRTQPSQCQHTGWCPACLGRSPCRTPQGLLSWESAWHSLRYRSTGQFSSEQGEFLRPRGKEKKGHKREKKGWSRSFARRQKWQNNHLHGIDGALGDDSSHGAGNKSLHDTQSLFISANQTFNLRWEDDTWVKRKN